MDSCYRCGALYWFGKKNHILYSTTIEVAINFLFKPIVRILIVTFKVLARDLTTGLLDGQFPFWTGEKFGSCLCGWAFLQGIFSMTTLNTANISTYFIEIVLVLQSVIKIFILYPKCVYSCNLKSIAENWVISGFAKVTVDSVNIDY